ncbi:MAG: oxidoreductase [Archangium sp.]
MTTPQAPLPSGFSATSTAKQVLGNKRLDGVTAIVTGGYAGIGLETTRVLAEAGAKVIVPARTPEKARAAVGKMPNVELEELDLANPASIDAFAARFLQSGRALQLLINNAGIMATPFEKDARGFESQFATNHLGHFQLTARLWPALKKANGARVVSLSSRGHARSPVVFDDPFFEKRAYDKWLSYGQAKTANVLFAVGLDARGQKYGVRAFAVHPGGIITDLVRSLSEEEKSTLLTNIQKSTVLKTIEEGAATTVWAATSSQLDGKGGVYCENADVAELVANDPTIGKGVRAYAIDPAQADLLWTKSEGWTGVRFEF